MFELTQNDEQNAKLKVLGVGGGGSNAVEYMLADKMAGVEYVVFNTDTQALGKSAADERIQLGGEITKGLGAGADPEIGRQAAQEDRERIREVVDGYDMVFITAGMGGGTGTGAAPVIAEVAKEMGVLTVAVVTKPFSFEGQVRKKVAEAGLKNLSENVDSLITIPNDKLLKVLGKNMSLLNAFKAANNVLQGAVRGIAELITQPGLINVDFADVRTVMKEMGLAMMGTGSASGENRARVAAEQAIACPLLEDVHLAGARGVLVNITGGMDMAIGEFEEVGEAIKGFTSDNATVVVGTVIDAEMTDEIRVTVVATGLGEAPAKSTIKAGEGTASSSIGQLKSADGTFNLRQLDQPTVLRKQPMAAMSAPQTNAPEAAKKEDNYLDIPAFLRRKDEKQDDSASSSTDGSKDKEKA